MQLDLKPGEFLDKQAIAGRMGVSRFPVGEAMNRLAAEGLVDIIPQSGSRVALIKISDARENMFFRRALEVETVRSIAADGAPALLEQLRSNLRYQQAAIEAQDLKGFHGFDLPSMPRCRTSWAMSGCGAPPRRRGSASTGCGGCSTPGGGWN